MNEGTTTLITLGNKPLPLIQVNPPSQKLTDKFMEEIREFGIYSNNGVLHKRASSVLAKQVNESYEGLLVSSNTTGLIASLIALGIRNRHVVLSNFTFSATLHAVILAGGIPVLCDISRDTLELDEVSLQKILNGKDLDIAAVIPTRVFGYVNDFSKIIKMCESKNIAVIIDSAATFPPSLNSWKFSTSPLCEVFSFHATKVFGIGEGGLVAGNPNFIERVKIAANFGLNYGEQDTFLDGLNAKSDEYNAARALSRLEAYEEDVRVRQEFVEIYKTIFNKFSAVKLLPDNMNTIYSYFPVIFETEKNLLLFKKELDKFILTRRYYYPTIFSGYIGQSELVVKSDLEISESISKRILCLPVYFSCNYEVRMEISNRIVEAMEVII